MSDLIISCRDLSKAYKLSHRGTGAKRYKTLRDDLMALPRRLWQLAKRHQSSVETLWALKDVSFEVKRGEVLGIIGRNGAGKSTLLKVLSRITDPSSGQVDLYGRVGSLLEVGTGFHPELTGRENIFLNGAILGMRRSEIARRFDEIVAFSEVEKFLDTPVKRFSSGMYMRLAFAVAAHLDPEIMVIDEVLAVGDADFQKKCLGKMKEVGNSGRTVLFVSHNMNAVEALCNRALLMDSGRVRQDSCDVASVIREHLFGAETNSSASEWHATNSQFDNSWFRPVRFFLGDENGARIGIPTSNQEGVWVHIDAEVEKLDSSLTVGYAIYSENGHLLYWSYQSDTAPHVWPPIRKGSVRLSSKIPPRFLNEGTYRVELIGGLHYRMWLFEPGVNAPSITLLIQGGLSDSPLWMVKRPGLLAPVFQWNARYEGT
ncbi:ATP-binding cassette domain-containing protein [bacterium]|nr:ATP-binding cassette domain-containing protein [bacterium]